MRQEELRNQRRKEVLQLIAVILLIVGTTVAYLVFALKGHRQSHGHKQQASPVPSGGSEK